MNEDILIEIYNVATDEAVAALDPVVVSAIVKAYGLMRSCDMQIRHEDGVERRQTRPEIKSPHRWA